MEYRIRTYVDELFLDAPDSQRAYEMKVELTQNLLDKYSDLVVSGYTEDEAYQVTVNGIGDITELLEEMRRQEADRNESAADTHPVWKAVMASYWPLVTAVYFLLSIVTGRWDLTWIIFVAAPAGYKIARALIEKK